MKRINRDGPPPMGEQPALPHLAIHQLAEATRDGIVLDVRTAAAFADGHLPGTLNIPLNRAFAKWAGSLLPDDRDIYVVAVDTATSERARRGLSAIGLDRVRGVLGPEIVTEARRLGTLTPPMSRVAIAHAKALQAAGRRIIDLRNDDEWAAGHFDRAEHHPLARLAEDLATLDRATPLAVHCQGGSRSAIGASLLEQMGFTDVVDLTGGWDAV